MSQDSTSAAITAATAVADTPQPRKLHPAIISHGDFTLRIIVVGAFFITLCIASFLGGCAVTEHRDGGGYTVRYAYNEPPPPPPKRRHVHRPQPTVIIVPEESHPVINLGQVDEIPREYAKFVSERGIRNWRVRSRMCAQRHPGYCQAPNISHCHGSYCHAHPGGEKRHTH